MSRGGGAGVEPIAPPAPAARRTAAAGRSLRVLLAAALLLVGAGAWAAQRAAAPAPLGRLGSVLSAVPAAPLAVPALPDQAVGTEVLPRGFSTDRAQTLLLRAGLPGLRAAPEVPRSGPEAVEARLALLAVNSVLADYTPAELAALPEEELQGLSAVVMDQMGSAVEDEEALRLAGLRSLAWKRTGVMRALRGRPLEEKLLNPGHTDMHAAMIDIRGVLDDSRLVLPEAEDLPASAPRHRLNPAVDGSTVFRYYAMKDDLPAVRAGAALWNGFVSYVQVSPYLYHKSYRDATGLFLTLPSFKGGDVGVPDTGGMAREAFVDLRLPAGLPLWDLEKGIFMVPLPRRTRGWILDRYLQWARGEARDRHQARDAARLDEEGGPGPRLEVPVEIVGHGRTR